MTNICPACAKWFTRSFLIVAAAICPAAFAQSAPGWTAELLGTRGDSEKLAGFAAAHPVEWDWLLQDGGANSSAWFETGAAKRLAEKAISEIKDARNEIVLPANAGDAQCLQIYAKACEIRREMRLGNVLAKTPKIVFTKHHTIRPSFFAYTEGQSDAQSERHFLPGSSLCLLEISKDGIRDRKLLDDPTGAIRDPEVSWDGKKILFAWKKSLNEDDYHLYEMDAASGSIRQITRGLGFADYEGAYLPDGGVVFASTRCVQSTDCFWTEVSNLYTCDANGKFLRRLGFDQVHTIHPVVNNDGRVIYTRWDYNDRGQVFPQPLFAMNPDGTAQTEFYGVNSWFPTTIAHARPIPGTHKVVAILCGHHTPQAGKLAVIDPAKGREENSGVQLVAPIRETKAVHVDAYGQDGELFQYPWPINENEFIVTYSPSGWTRDEHAKRHRGEADFGIYWMSADGRRELLVNDPEIPCNQPVPLIARTPPPSRPSFVDYRKKTGTFYVQNIYEGPGLEGIARGTVKKLRVIALDFRAAVIGSNSSGGPGGGAMSSTPVSIGNGTWDVKNVLGDAKVFDDGSVFFTAPAKTPVYFQAIDEHGRAVQTMRSWATLQPGENQSCVGCHESRNASALSPARGGPTLALHAGAQELEQFYGPPRGFSFAKEIQPILNSKCVSCHDQRTPGTAPAADGKHAFSLLAETTLDRDAKRLWSDSYLALTAAKPRNPKNPEYNFFGNYEGKLVNWIGAQSVPSMLPPNFAGSSKSELIPLLEKNHRGVSMTREEMEKICCWIDLLVPYCGDYREANAWTPEESARYEHYFQKRRSMQAEEDANIDAFISEKSSPPAKSQLTQR